MTSKWLVCPVIVTCLLSAAVLLGGCSPPLPKTLLLPSGGTMYDIHVPIDRLHATAATALTPRH
jgi:hypothetical protein